MIEYAREDLQALQKVFNHFIKEEHWHLFRLCVLGEGLTPQQEIDVCKEKVLYALRQTLIYGSWDPEFPVSPAEVETAWILLKDKVYDHVFEFKLGLV